MRRDEAFYFLLDWLRFQLPAFPPIITNRPATRFLWERRKAGRHRRHKRKKPAKKHSAYGTVQALRRELGNLLDRHNFDVPFKSDPRALGMFINTYSGESPTTPIEQSIGGRK